MLLRCKWQSSGTRLLTGDDEWRRAYCLWTLVSVGQGTKARVSMFARCASGMGFDGKRDEGEKKDGRAV